LLVNKENKELKDHKELKDGPDLKDPPENFTHASSPTLLPALLLQPQTELILLSHPGQLLQVN
jgi:hypothetical protein